jgi:hypothetical protein
MALFMLTLALFGYRGMLAISASPHGGPDAISIWNGRARMLFRSGAAAADNFARMERSHPDYPLFLSAGIAGQFSLWGEESTGIQQATSIALAAATALAVYVAIGVVATREVALTGTVLLLVTPAFGKWSFDQYSDIALGYVAVLGLGGLLSLRERESGSWPPVLVGFLLGLLVWVKDEGVVLLLSFLCGLALCALTTRWKALSWIKPLQLFGGMALPISATARFKTTWASTSQIKQLLQDQPWAKLFELERWQTVALAFWTELNPLLERRTWGLIWPVVGLVAIVRWRRLFSPVNTRLTTVSVLASLLGYYAIYLFTPHPLPWHLRTSSQRLFLQLLPLVLVWAAALVGSFGPAAAPGQHSTPDRSP